MGNGFLRGKAEKREMDGLISSSGMKQSQINVILIVEEDQTENEQNESRGAHHVTPASAHASSHLAASFIFQQSQGCLLWKAGAGCMTYGHVP